MARYTSYCPMRWSDMDANGHINNVPFLTYLEEARIDMLQDLIAQAKATDGVMSAGILVANTAIEYKLPLVHRIAPVPIEVWITKIGGAFFDLAYEVADDPDTVYARATSRMVTFDFTRNFPRRLRPHEKDFLRRYLEP
ncbi:MAG: acyl-CoA thioesterase [Actinomycetota bacterium]|nr:acyl-CoA thioesterase [Actinomycetota bacterium]